MVASLMLLVRSAVVLIGRRDLWGTALRQLAVLCPPKWWTRAPYLPVPDADYLRFRLQTAYGGSGDAAIEPSDLVAYLEWCVQMQRLQRAH